MLGAALIFPVAGTFYISGDFQNSRELDGLAFERRGNPDEYAGARWLQENVEGAPVVLEGVGGDYSLGGPRFHPHRPAHRPGLAHPRVPPCRTPGSP